MVADVDTAGSGAPRHRAALIGCGRIGSLLEDDPLRGKPCTHAGAMSALADRLALVALCDVDAARLAAAGERWGVPALYRSAAEMLAAERPDIVVVAAPTRLHAALTMEASRCGARGVLCEKPLAWSVDEARKMIRHCRERGTALLINHERRFDPHFRLARRLIRDGQIGPVRSLVGKVVTAFGKDLAQGVRADAWRCPDEDGDLVGHGPLAHDGTHLIDAIRFLTGAEVSWVSARVDVDSAARIDHSAAALLELTGGAHVFLEAGGRRDYFEFSLEVDGRDGRLRIGNGIWELALGQTSARYTGFRDLVPGQPPAPSADEQLAANPWVGAVAELLDAVDGGREPESSGADGLAALSVIAAIHQSARTGRPVLMEHPGSPAV
ncbi:MAG: Gfo/Idh/MocA family oxidoreductase [Candidatus Schekmanbacteria bacterium]|nr:Gfo/Idh/MocA family oxidoreductase [Candidatus Schekmanbacteria bacterium]